MLNTLLQNIPSNYVINVFYWCKSSGFYPHDLYDGSIFFYNDMLEAIKISKDSYFDAKFLYYQKEVNESYIYLDCYTTNIVLEERPFQDKDLYLSQNFKRYWRKNLHDEFIPNNWYYLNSWQIMRLTNDLGLYTYPEYYYFSDLTYPFEEYSNSKIYSLHIKYYENKKKNAFNIWYHTLRSLKHHDFVIGQYFTINYGLNGLPNATWYPGTHMRDGLYFSWFERYGSFEVIWKAVFSYWYEVRIPLMLDWFYIEGTTIAQYDVDNFGPFTTKIEWWFDTVEDIEAELWPLTWYYERGVNMYVGYA